MERLTIPDEKIEGGWRRAIIDAREVRKEAMTIYWALKKYEDTGLTPPEIMELKERDTAKKPITYTGTNRADCPVCRAMVRGIGKPFGDFCGKCGQRLRWED